MQHSQSARILPLQLANNYHIQFRVHLNPNLRESWLLLLLQIQINLTPLGLS